MTSLSEALAQYGTAAYLVTVSPDGPHITHVDVTLVDGVLKFDLGGKAVTNAAENRNVSLFWPPTESGGYDIMLNGELTMNTATQATVSINKCVFYRPGTFE